MLLVDVEFVLCVIVDGERRDESPQHYKDHPTPILPIVVVPASVSPGVRRT
jgi:hypothetical protein